MAEPDKTNGTTGGATAAPWPTAPHRITRILQGRVSARPWVLVSAGRTRALDPTAGLLALSDLGSERSMFSRGVASLPTAAY